MVTNYKLETHVLIKKIMGVQYMTVGQNFAANSTVYGSKDLIY